jgi:hypothetical protein
VRILDAGAGDAWFARQLVDRHPNLDVTCSDVAYTAARIRKLEEDTGGRIRFFTEVPDERFHAVTLLDVLEHTEDDAAFLANVVNDHLLPSGVALVSVPAWQSLFSRHDTALRHYRRYSPRQLSTLVEGAGLVQLRGGGLFHTLMLPRALGVAMERLVRSRSAVEATHELRWDHGTLLTTEVRWALWLDNLVSRVSSRMSLHLPGLSAWCLCKKPA